ncbi:MAG: UPF0262 family protein [Bauldia sp.]|nr:UPF0262 family protein [Bauldia sp.]
MTADDFVSAKPGKLVEVELDADSIAVSNAEVESERVIAIHDLLESNRFLPEGFSGGTYKLRIGLYDKMLALEIGDAAGQKIVAHVLSLAPLRRILDEYAEVCESYYAAVKSASPSQLEAIDMGRRGLHDEGAAVLRERLAGKITLDRETARRLFTLVFALHWKG